MDPQTLWKKNEDESLYWQEAQHSVDTKSVLYDLAKDVTEVGSSNL